MSWPSLISLITHVPEMSSDITKALESNNYLTVKLAEVGTQNCENVRISKGFGRTTFDFDGCQIIKVEKYGSGSVTSQS
jgi:hypothetical protein